MSSLICQKPEGKQSWEPGDIGTVVSTINRYEKDFLDLEIHPTGISIYRKETHTAEFINFNSFTKWNHKVAWIKSLATRAKKLCSPNKLTTVIRNIKIYASFNGFPQWITNKIIKNAYIINSMAMN